MHVPRSRLLVVAMLAGLVPVLAVAGCGSSGGSAAGDGGATTSTTTAAPSTTASPTTAGSTTTAPGLDGASFADQSGPAVGTKVALLTAIRVAHNPGFDRVVFEFRGDDRPTWSVGYASGPFSSDGAGEPVTVQGTDFLRVVMQGGSGFDLDTGEQTYTGPTTVTAAGATHVKEVVRQGDFEAQLTWIIGLDASVKFKVSTLTSPSRLVIDIAD